jgi:hypothetical protein
MLTLIRIFVQPGRLLGWFADCREGVRTVQTSILLKSSILLFCVTSWAEAQRPCDDTCKCEPRIRFLDDLCCGLRVSSQRNPYEERIETERHDFTQSTKTVGRGVIQLEGGYTYFYKDFEEEIEQTHTFPEGLLRIGVSDDIEFRLRWSYAWQTIDVDEDLESAQDLIWSIKLGITEECGWIPESALEIRSSVPTGGSAFTLGRVEAGFDYIFGWELTEDWDLYGSFGYLGSGLGDISLIPEEQGDNFDVWSTSAALGVELTEKSTVYFEWFGLFSAGLGEEDFTVSIFNVGVDYYLSDNLVVDFRVGKGLTDDSDDFFSGIGGGYRF